MLNANALPPLLLDLTVSRICTRCTRSQVHKILSVRGAHAAARLAPQDTADYEPPPFNSNLNRAIQENAPNFLGLRPQRGQELRSPKSELERRVKALEGVATQEETSNEVFYSENDLLALYEDLLTLPPEMQAMSSSSKDASPSEEEIVQCSRLVDAAERRLATMSSATNGMLDSAESDQEWIHSEDFSRPMDVDINKPSYQRIIRAASDILGGTDTGIELDVQLQQKFPVSILQLDEWDAVVKLAVHSGDGAAAQDALALIKHCGLVVPDDMLDSVLTVYTAQGDVLGFEKALTRFARESPNESQRHMHIKTHMRACSTEEMPESALAVLHNYEDQALPAPMKTYTSVITHLFGLRSSTAKAHGWDLFSHMRYVAHPIPDARLYALMIRACASPIHVGFKSEPERALDLWQEMRDKNILPTVDVYNAAILACTRSGEKSYIAEGFRLAKEMLDAHRDARGRQAFKPDRNTFCALLEGAKRIGDLARARWILAELVRMSGQEGAEDLAVDEEVMTHVFHAYASYNPPFSRRLARLVDDNEADPNTASATELSDATQDVDAPERSFRHLAPQSKSEVLGEVDSLLEQVRLESRTSTDPTFKFRNVKPSSKLLNAYLSVHYRHDTFEKCRNIFWEVFEQFDVTRSPRAYLEAMNKCAHAPKRDRDAAQEFAEEIMAKWRYIENSDAGVKIDARVVEKMHVLYIRLLSHHDPDAALTHLRAFATRYPPASLRAPSKKPQYRSTRTSLVSPRPLVRLSSPIEVPDDSVPPFVTFNDLEFLHHQLLAVGDIQGIGYVKFLTKSYEWALRVRRDESTKSTPQA